MNAIHFIILRGFREFCSDFHVGCVDFNNELAGQVCASQDSNRGKHLQLLSLLHFQNPGTLTQRSLS